MDVRSLHINNSIKYKTQIQAIIAVFLISPFLSFVYAIKNYKAPYAKNVIWAFTIFYGLTFVISNEGMDANRYAEKLVSMHFNATDIESFKRFVFDGDTAYIDIILPVVTFLVSLFTDESKFLFAVFAFIFGYFFSRNVWFLIEHSKEDLKKYSIIIIITFAFIAGIWKITNFRWWTALHMFVYGILPFLYYNNKKYLWFCVLSCLTHFSFMFPTAALAGYLLLGNRLHLYFILFTISFFVAQLDLEFVSSQLSFLPDLLKERTAGYTSQDYLDRKIGMAQNMNWYAQVYVNMMAYALNFLIFLIYFKFRKHISVNKEVYSYFCFMLYISAVTNTVSSIPSIWRFLSLSQMIQAAAIFMVFQYNDFNLIYKKSIRIATPMLIFFMVVTMRVAFDTIGINTILGNIVSAVLISDDYALIQLIK